MAQPAAAPARGRRAAARAAEARAALERSRSEVVPGGAPPSAAWDALEGKLSAAVVATIGLARFSLWFHGHVRFVEQDRHIAVVTRNESCRDWLEHTFGDAVCVGRGSGLPARARLEDVGASVLAHLGGDPAELDGNPVLVAG